MLHQVIFGKLKRFPHFPQSSIEKGLEAENEGLKNIDLTIKIYINVYNLNVCMYAQAQMKSKYGYR